MPSPQLTVICATITELKPFTMSGLTQCSFTSAPTSPNMSSANTSSLYNRRNNKMKRNQTNRVDVAQWHYCKGCIAVPAGPFSTPCRNLCGIDRHDRAKRSNPFRVEVPNHSPTQGSSLLATLICSLLCALNVISDR